MTRSTDESVGLRGRRRWCSSGGPLGAAGQPRAQQDGTGRGHGSPARGSGHVDGPRRGLASPDRQDRIAERMGAY